MWRLRSFLIKPINLVIYCFITDRLPLHLIISIQFHDFIISTFPDAPLQLFEFIILFLAKHATKERLIFTNYIKLRLITMIQFIPIDIDEYISRAPKHLQSRMNPNWLANPKVIYSIVPVRDIL